MIRKDTIYLVHKYFMIGFVGFRKKQKIYGFSANILFELNIYFWFKGQPYDWIKAWNIHLLTSYLDKEIK